MSILASNVRHAVTILRGTGRAKEAENLHEALLKGLDSDVLRAAAQRELAEPGAIMRMASDHRMRQEQQEKEEQG